MSKTSWQVKERYNAKNYKSINLKLKPEVYDALTVPGKSRPEVIMDLIDSYTKTERNKLLKIELNEKIESKEGVWLQGYNPILHALIPDYQSKRKYMPIKVLRKEDDAHMYYIRDDDIPCYMKYDSPYRLYFSQDEKGVILHEVAVGAKKISYEGDQNDKKAINEYLKKFFAQSEPDFTKEEYMEILNKGVASEFPIVTIDIIY